VTGKTTVPTAEVLPTLFPPEMPPGATCGPYAIVRPLGEGGMGRVYLAERADVGLQVALKVVREGRFAAPDRVRRFLRERRVLARLEHPHIARLLDAGVTSAGTPYLAMELVEGEPLTAWCERRRLPLPERLRLFRQVCAAVHYAHGRLVVHRDLKPSNVLVDRDGAVKLLDFGVAKLLDDEERDETAITREAAPLATPEYAAPEQLAGEPVTTASDVYALGVVLYELLTARRPHYFASRAPADIAGTLATARPEPPSAVVPRTDPLRRRLRGDLDAITLKALARDPADRYTSVGQLADDIERYGAGRPTLARRAPVGERVARFVRRHRVGVAAGSLLGLTLLAGAGATAWQARQAEAARALAERRYHDVREMTTSLLFEVHDAISDLPGATEARALLVGRGLEYLDRLAGEAAADRALQWELAQGYVRLARVQGDLLAPSLGDVAGALQSYRKGVTLARDLVASDPADAAVRRTLTLALRRMSDLEAAAGDLPLALEHAREALRHAESVRAADSTVVGPVVLAHLQVGDLLGHPYFPSLGDRAGALEQYRNARTALGDPPPRGGRPSVMLRHSALVAERIGAVLSTEGRHAEALTELQRSLALRELLASDADAGALDQRNLAVAHLKLCELRLRLGQTGEAHASCDQALAGYSRLRAADPGNLRALSDLANGHAVRADVLLAEGRAAAAAAELRRSLGYRRQVIAADTANAQARRDLLAAERRLAVVEQRR
jgi:tetratricopeptide (TPR) repeat protein